jgi:hypothetical protein
MGRALTGEFGAVICEIVDRETGRKREIGFKTTTRHLPPKTHEYLISDEICSGQWGLGEWLAFLDVDCKLYWPMRGDTTGDIAAAIGLTIE